VGPEHSCEFLKRLQPRPHGRVDPFEQMLFGTPRLLVAPEQLEGFLQVPGSDQGRVPPHERGKPLFLVVGQTKDSSAAARAYPLSRDPALRPNDAEMLRCLGGNARVLGPRTFRPSARTANNHHCETTAAPDSATFVVTLRQNAPSRSLRAVGITSLCSAQFQSLELLRHLQDCCDCTRPTSRRKMIR
jgi:hypothetical protein